MEVGAFDNIRIPEQLRGNQTDRLDFISKKIQRLLRSGQFKGRKCVLAIPAESSFVRHIRIPHMEADKIEPAIHQALQGELPYSVQEAVVRHILAGEIHQNGETFLEVIVVAVPLGAMDAYLNMTNHAGLEVVAVSVEPVAIVECFTSLFPLGETDQQSVLFVDFGSQSTQLVISRGRKVAFARNIAYGAEELEQAYSAGLGISREKIQAMREDLLAGRDSGLSGQTVARWAQPWLRSVSDDIERSLRYYEHVFQQSGVDRVVFTGGQARDEWLCRSLAEHLHLPAQIGNPLLGLAATRANSSSCPGLAVGMGLSLSGKGL
jgi:type IV pilus assembly protein PilM